MFRRLLILSCSVSCALHAADLPPPAIMAAEIQELKSVVQSLREDKLRLEAQNQQLTLELVNLGRQLRALQNTPAAPQPAPPAPLVPQQDPPVALVASNQLLVLYVNPTWHYLLINAGSNQGLQTGKTGSVLRNGEIIAGIRITDTKANQATAELDLNSLGERGVYPRKDDEVRFP